MKKFLSKWNLTDVQALTLSLFLGAYWGVFIDLQWTELVESGRVYSGEVEAYIPWYATGFSSQIVLSALMFKTGISLDLAAIILSAITVALAFISVSAVVLIFTNIKAVALITPILLCKFPFYNFHYYPIKFPNYNFVFGQTGMYMALLTISLLVLRKSKMAYFLAGIMLSVHMVWGAGCILFFIFYNVLYEKNRITKNEFLLLLSSLIISIITYYYFLELENQFEERQKTYSSVLFDKSLSVDPIYINSIDLYKKTELQIDDAPLMMTRSDLHKSGRNSHNILFSDSRYPLIEGIKFFLPEIGLFLLFYLLSKNKMLESDRGRIFALALILLQSTVILYKLFDEIDPTWSILNWISPKLVGLFMRGIPHRILNLDSIILPSILICLLINIAITKKNYIFTGIFVLILICPFMPNTAGKNLGFTELINLLYPQIIIFCFSFFSVYIFLIMRAYRRNEKFF